MTSSQIPRFYQLSVAERRAALATRLDLTQPEVGALSSSLGLHDDQADRMVENALGVFGMPLGLCVNLRINGQDFLAPMVVEEPSVIAAASHAAKMLRHGDGVIAEASPPHMIGQIQVLDVPDFASARAAILAQRDSLLAEANACDPLLVSLGGGAFDIELRHLPPMPGEDDPLGPMLIVHLLVDVRDAMGANAVNTMCERLAPRIEGLSGGRVRLRILSNLADRRTVTVTGRVPFSALDGKGEVSGEALALGIQEASVFAERDPYRAATHNKGIMNGIDAVLIAFGQDWRAVEAGAHAYAARTGRYTALSRWRVRDGFLEGRMTLPMAVGIVGGVIKVHPTVQTNRRLAAIQSAEQLASITAAVGLAQNLGALRALSAEGIQKGHMRLHARNFAVEAGAVGHEVDELARLLASQGHVRADLAAQLLAQLRSRNPTSSPQ
jgi:hydroxymethylglutaryl-CoA reductase